MRDGERPLLLAARGHEDAAVHVVEPREVAELAVLLGLEGLVVDDRGLRERHAALRADADRVARQVVLVQHRRAALEHEVVERVEVRVRLGRHHVEQIRARRGHAERIAVVRADLVDGAVADDLHHLIGAADRADRQAPAERLGQRDHVGHDAELLDGAAGGDRHAGLDLVEDQDDPVLLRDLADGLEVAGLGEHDAEVHHRRLHDHAGGQATLLGEALDAALHRGGVIERHRDRHVGHGLRDATAVGEGRVVLAVADRGVVDADRDHHVVVVAVVRAEDLDDRVAARGGARDADRIHRGLGARVRVPPLRQAPAALQLVGDDDRVLGRGGEVRALLHALDDGLRDDRVRMALDHRAEAVVEVDHLRAVDVPDVRADAALEVDRPRIAELVRRGDAARQGAERALVHASRARRVRVELLGLAGRQLGDALAVELNWGAYGHGSSSAR